MQPITAVSAALLGRKSLSLKLLLKGQKHM